MHLPLPNSRGSQRRASALVIVLACVILISALLISYFAAMQLDRQATFNYSNTVKAQELGRGGLAEVLGDLCKEIDAGSMPDGQPTGASYKVNGVRAYIPRAAGAAQAARIGFPAAAYTGTNPLSRSVLRVSRAHRTNDTSDSFFTSPPTYYDSTKLPPNRASAVSSTNRSKNNRIFTADRWNAPYLLGMDATKVPDTFRNNSPDWVYVTRSGSKTLTDADVSGLLPSPNQSATNQLLGRYAFVVYDEGSLLDMNAAGFPASASTETNATNPALNGTNAIRAKTFTAYADLTCLPGLTGQASAVDALVNWRSKGAIAQNSGKFIPTTVASSATGFLTFQAKDNPLLSRQDLIGYFKNTPALASNLSPLSCLGTFSRAVTAPSWGPVANAVSLGGNNGTGNVYAYKDNAENSASANRNLANVRFKAGGAITHYDDNAQPQSPYTVNQGDPLLQSRFSLARIGWLSSTAIGGTSPGSGPNPATGAGPNPTYATAIQSCFGLRWGVQGRANGGNACWTYVGSNGGTSPAATIETLDQVASENREPNFFELLKAAILSGSLGLGPGPTAWQNGTKTPYRFGGYGNGSYDTSPGPEGLDVYSFDRPVTTVPSPIRVPDMQIMRIGANIIDQYDADSYPTAIYFKYQGMITDFDAAGGGLVDPLTFGDSTMAYGIENLPCLMASYMIAGTVKNTDTQGMNGWLQPQIWNPNQMPAAPNATAPPPTTYQIRAYGKSYLSWYYENDQKTLYTLTDDQMHGETSLPSPGLLDGNYITLTCSTPTSYQQFYTTPWATTSTLSGIVCTTSGTNAAHMTPDPLMQDYAKNPFVAFWLGNDLAGPQTYHVYPDNDSIPPATPTRQQTKVYLDSTGCTLVLGWLDSSGGFHPYSFMINPLGSNYGVVGTEKNGGATPHANTGSATPQGTGGDCHFTVDPRTGRFGTLADWGGVMFNTTLYANLGNNWKGGRMSDTYGWGSPAPGGANFLYDPSYGNALANGVSRLEIDWMFNTSTSKSVANGRAPNPATVNTYYNDLDGVLRPGDGLFGNPSTGDGMLLYTGVTAYAGYPNLSGSGTPTGSPIASGDKATGSDTGNNSHGRRSVILNRPFRSVGEIGYAYRDLPFKTLDLFSAQSADAALLDVFSLVDEAVVAKDRLSPIVAGRVNLENAPEPVIEAILSGAALKDFDSTYNLSKTLTTMLSTNVVAKLQSVDPLMSRADLATVLGKTIHDGFTNSADLGNKAYFEGPVRALAGVTDMRTWNLLIDVVAQSGKMVPSASKLDDFVVEGEKRYWLHVAIDRYTGKVVDQQLEPVYE